MWDNNLELYTMKGIFQKNDLFNVQRCSDIFFFQYVQAMVHYVYTERRLHCLLLFGS